MITPEEFASGALQVLDKAPAPPLPDFDAWLGRIAEAYPPYRDVREVPVDRPKRGQPTVRQIMSSPENDPFVIAFLTDVLGDMVGVETADRLYTGKVSGYYANHQIDDHVRAAYGRRVCVWAPHDEAWSLLFQRDDIEIDCHKRPTVADMRKLVFVAGWFTMRTQTYALRGKWRRVQLDNSGARMRDYK